MMTPDKPLNEAKTSPQDGQQFDVIVVGGGGAGFAAAVTAGLQGLKVALLEKAPVYGGVTAIAGGGIWIPNNPVSKATGAPDTEEAALTYFKNCTGSRFDPVRANAFLKNGPKMVEYFERHDAIKSSVIVGRPDYHPRLPGSGLERTLSPMPFDGQALGEDIRRLRPGPRVLTFLGMMIKPGPDLQHFYNVFRSLRSTVFVTKKLARYFLDVARYGRGLDLLSGNALIGRLAKRAHDCGVQIFTSVNVTDLVKADGRITGIRFEAGGSDGTIHARRGVVLACGGFPHDSERQKKVFPHVKRGGQHWSPAPEYNTGDGVRMAEAIGAKFNDNLAHPAGWAPVSRVPFPDGKVDVFPHLIDRQKPGFVAVTKHGKRFVNESSSYHDFGEGFIDAMEGEDEVLAFLVADHATVRRYGLGFVKPAPVPFGRHLRSGYLIRGRTLRELAERAGIEPVQFQKTIETFNRNALEGRDPDFGRGETSLNRFLGDASHEPNPCLAPVENGPFYAVKLYMGELGTFAGISADEYARALDHNGAPIPGLYVVGNDMSHVMAGDYMAAGSNIGPGLTFGFIAGCHLAGVDSLSVQ